MLTHESIFSCNDHLKDRINLRGLNLLKKQVLVHFRVLTPLFDGEMLFIL